VAASGVASAKWHQPCETQRGVWRNGAMAAGGNNRLPYGGGIDNNNIISVGRRRQYQQWRNVSINVSSV